MENKLKVAVIFNETVTDYGQKEEIKTSGLGFRPYFDIEESNPIEEFEVLVTKLNEIGFEAYSLNIQDNIELITEKITEEKPDVVFNFVEIFNDNARLEMNVAGVLELMQIPYTGSGPITLANCQNKTFVKRLLKSAGLPTPEFILFEKDNYNYDGSLNFPLIVKPAYEDASTGIENESIVNDEISLQERLKYIYTEHNQPALVEEFIDGRELNVSIMGNENPVVFPISEIDFSKMPGELYHIVSYQAKWEPEHIAYHKTRPICPAKLPKGVTAYVQEIALKAYKLLEVRDYARVDIRLSKDNKPYILEVNPNPHIDEGVGFMRSAEAYGLPYEEALKRIIMLAYERGKRK